MIISHKYKFLFLHIPKTAGSSLNSILGSVDDNVISTRTISINDEPFCVTNTIADAQYLEDARERKATTIYFEKSIDFAHPYYPINKYLCGNLTDDPSYFSFSFVRNPFDRIVSAYTYAKRRREFEEDSLNADPNFNFSSFTDFCKNYLIKSDFCDPVTRYNVHFLPQYRFVYEPQELVLNGGSPFVSYIGRFEKLEQDFNYIRKKIGIGEGKLPRIRDQKRKKHYSEYYDKESREIVEAVYKKDLELFNYSFGEIAKTPKSLFDSRHEILCRHAPNG